MQVLDVGENGEKVDEAIESLRRLATLGITHVHTSVRGDEPMATLRTIGEQVIPAVADF